MPLNTTYLAADADFIRDDLPTTATITFRAGGSEVVVGTKMRLRKSRDMFLEGERISISEAFYIIKSELVTVPKADDRLTIGSTQFIIAATDEDEVGQFIRLDLLERYAR